MRLLPRALRSRRDRQASLLVLVAMAAFVAAVYIVVVLGGGALIGHTDAPQLGLSVLATAIVALGFEPMQRRVDTLVQELVHAGRPSAYAVLSRFTDDVSGSMSDEELPSRMANVLAEGTGARWAQVWLLVNDRPVLAGTWPAEDAGSAIPQNDMADSHSGLRSRDVTLGEERLGVLRLQEYEDRPLTIVEERLFAGLADQAGLVLHGSRLRAELAQRLRELSLRSDELTRSRERLVDTQDAGRRRLERDIHDGAQQHLVALAVNLRLAQTLASRAPDRARQVLADQVGATRTAIDTLVDLSQGIFPAALIAQGLAGALREATVSSSLPVTVQDSGVGRWPPDVESALYFCCLEALQNAAKHAAASRVTIALAQSSERILVEVADDGSGFDPAEVEAGEGLANMRDRIDAAGGELTIETVEAGGTRVLAWVPATQTALVG